MSAFKDNPVRVSRNTPNPANSFTHLCVHPYDKPILLEMALMLSTPRAEMIMLATCGFKMPISMLSV